MQRLQITSLECAYAPFGRIVSEKSVDSEYTNFEYISW